jgi:hypothetical protein
MTTETTAGPDEIKPRACKALNVRGGPCRSTSVGESGLCAFHDGNTPLGTAEGARRAAARSADVRRERAVRRSMTLRDLMAAELERRAEEIVAAYLTAGIEQGDWRALDALVSRVHGKPKETVETIQRLGWHDARGAQGAADRAGAGRSRPPATGCGLATRLPRTTQGAWMQGSRGDRLLVR